MVLEANSHGQGLVRGLRNWPNLYWRRDLVNGKVRQEIGWLTGPATKPFMMQQLDAQLPTMITHDETFVRQIRRWRKQGDTKVTATGLTDYFMAGCLAVVGALTVVPGRTKGFQGFSGWSW